MAEVTGYLGAEEITLNNAATESTLRELVNAIGVLSTRLDKGGRGAKSQAQVEKELKKFHEQLKKSGESLKKETAEEKKNTAETAKNTKEEIKNTKATKENTQTLEKMAAASGYVANELKKAGSSVFNVISGTMTSIAGMGDSMTGAAQAFNNIPIVGGVLAGVFGSIAEAATNSYTAFRQSASVGANFTGSINEMIDSASGAGLTIDQFTGIISRNGQSLSILGAGTAEGARQMARLGKEMRNSGVADTLARMGYSTEEINEGMVQFGGRLARTGRAQQMSTTQLAQITGEYLKELDAVSKLTGKSKQALQEEEEARMRDAQYLTMKNKLDAEGQKNLEILMSSIPEGMQAGAKEVLATGTATTEAGRQFLAYMNRSGQNLSSLSASIRQSGTLTTQQIRSAYKTIQTEGAELSKSSLGETLGLFDTSTNDLIVSANRLRAQQEAGLDIDTALLKAQEDEIKMRQLQSQGLDPANMMKFQQQIAEASNQFTKLLANNLPMLMNAFDLLMKVVQEFVVPAFDWLAKNGMQAFQDLSNNAEKFIDYLKIAGGVLVGYKALQLGKAVFDIFAGKGTMMNPMVVTDIGGGGGFGGDGGGGKKGKKGKVPKGKFGAVKGLTKAAGTLAKRIPIAGALLSVGMGAAEYADVDKQVEAGELTKEEAKKEKTKVVAGTAGEAGGALAGAAAGAAIGSVVPLIGTAIGGLIGAGVGAWLGRKGGNKVAEMVSSEPDVKKTTVDADVKASEALKKQQSELDAKKKALDTSKQSEEKEKEQLKAQEEMSKIEATPELTSQDDTEALLLSLNTKMEQLIKIAGSQLSVQRGLSSDLYA